MRHKHPVTLETLRKKVAYWQNKTGLWEWHIAADYADEKKIGDNAVAMVTDTSVIEKIANIFILKDYHKTDRFDKIYNLDTIILHELMHVYLWAEIDKIPSRVRKLRAIKDLEEFICDHMADMVFYLNARKKMKKAR